ncbi:MULTISPECIES: methionine ABC transporter ATP-binding protein [unclassified Undibacterium]|uniref:methionine ABC transporter ATP-binding protein n=2 Tax=Undibacterium TaxID=401469 RepID=UPI002AC8A4EC|nr:MULTISPECIES: ATP-binding cassette domain-containing protein [unclassified Undibacterium]MEB0137724.1 ATP-binding cassette domain-containing protein [Undibacterium sp. CCC2.1]MEB0172834.1 ATP-binding cassette domain-containing protein [Undibacterium sp. CCC1.1]MEB0176692.1 ATP-binding cassette domain-containing protein [Undibacterium sp. CCC3.4]MEB0215982.1 ATP-binding cassette domain-containing protein [Undibacterium sp. 5I2]WPX42299.1 ATP-binding cassette domain-containing protein [Undiba
MIHIEQVEKIYRVGNREVHALRNIDLSVRKGEIFGIIGRSGAGKSSLLRALNLLERPSAGKVFIDGVDIMGLDAAGLHALRQRTGMVFQHFNLLNAKTVEQNIAFPLKLAGGFTCEQKRERVAALLALVGLTEQAHQYPAQLSGGQKQRVGIARALANYPQLLLCDEATSALDPETTQSILRLLLQINQQLGLTIVLITHEMQVIRTICDQVAVLEAGEIVETGAVSDVFLHPQHAVTQSMVAEHQALSPDLFEAQRAGSLLLRLTYVGNTAHEPVLSRVAAQTGAEFVILQGTIGRIKDIPYGQLQIALTASPQQTEAALALLRAAEVRVELIASEGGQ